MAKLILPADAVPVYLTHKIQTDLVARGVFPGLTGDRALHVSSTGMATFSVTVREARSLEADAKQQAETARGSMKWAFRCLAKSLTSSIDEVPARLAMLGAREPRRESGRLGEELVGTKEQLQAVGIGVGMSFPGESDAKRWFKTKDDRGFSARVAPCWRHPHWRVFRVELELPKEVKEEHERERRAQQDSARRAEQEVTRLKALPKSADEFREGAARGFWLLASVTLGLMRPELGLRYDAETIAEVKSALSDAYWLLKQGDTEGQTAAAVLASRAKADKPLQSFLARVDGPGRQDGRL
jgi:hypothetical protein